MKDVIISIKGAQQSPGEEENVIEMETDGKYSYENGTVRIDYMESELTGMEGTRTELEVTGTGVTITRTGTVSSQMVFIMGEKNYFMYNTTYGSFTIGLDTKKIEADLSESGGSLEVRYQLDTDSVLLSKNSLQIQIREV